MKDEYIPISCTSYDQFEYAAMRKQLLEIKFKHEGQVLTIQERAINLKTENKKEFLITDNRSIRLDKIESIREV